MDKAANIAITFIALLITTTLVLPGRTTPTDLAILSSGAQGLAKTGLGQN